MTSLVFTVPPLLQYIACGHTIFVPGDRHMTRRNIRVFDLLFVRKGGLFIGEEDRRYEMKPGCALVLRPDACHYGVDDCKERTEYYWLHFQASGPWTAAADPASGEHPTEHGAETLFDVSTFHLTLPQFSLLPKPSKADELLNQLTLLHPNAHLSAARLKQQLLFQELVQLLAASHDARRGSPGRDCAERAAAVMRSRYREDLSVGELGKLLNFHPVYIARCMQREYGCTPKEYLLRYRIEQSKLLLMQTDWTVARIAEEVGFRQAPYFSTCFSRIEGMTPRDYRQLFH